MSRRVLVLALAVVVGAVVVARLAGDDDDPRAGSVEVHGAQALTIGPVPSRYRIDYRVTVDDITTTERLVVDRPFAARLETRAGAPPGSRRLSVTAAALSRSSTQSARAAPAILAAVPGPAAPDLRVDAVLAAAREAGLAIRREQRLVAGRRCQVYRTGSGLGTAALAKPTRARYVDACIDGAGLVLEQVRFEDGDQRERRVAVAVTVGGPVPDRLFRIGEPTIPARSGGGSVQRVDPASTPPGTFWVMEGSPEGFTHLGRYAVVPPQPENFADPAREGFRRAGVVDVYLRGPDVITIDQGGTLHRVDPFALGDGQRVDLGQLPAGELLLTGHGSEVRTLTGRGNYVTVSGTVAPDAVLTVARALRPVPGGSLVYL